MFLRKRCNNSKIVEMLHTVTEQNITSASWHKTWSLTKIIKGSHIRFTVYPHSFSIVLRLVASITMKNSINF